MGGELLNGQENLVGNMDCFCGESKEEKWLRRWNESCDAMTEKYEKINKNQPVITRKATKDEMDKWGSVKKNPFKLGE